MRQSNAQSSATIVASMGRDLEAFCQTLNVDLPPLLKSLGLDATNFEDFDARMSFDAFCRLLEVLSTLSDKETIGIDYANFFRPGGTGALGQGLAVAPNVEAVFRFLTTHMTIIVDHRIYEATYEREALTIEWSYSPLITSCDQYTDFAVRSTVRTLDAITAGRQTYGIFSFQRQTPRNTKLFRQAFPGKLLFGQETNRVEFKTDLFDMANPNSNPTLFELMQQTCVKIANERRSNKPFDLSLREDIMESLPSGGLDIETAARRHGMSVRTLQRRLEDFEMTYETLLDDVRSSLTEVLLKDPNKSMAQIAEAVGYSDQSAFSRAIVKRFQMTPTQLRAALTKD